MFVHATTTAVGFSVRPGAVTESFMTDTLHCATVHCRLCCSARQTMLDLVV